MEVDVIIISTGFGASVASTKLLELASDAAPRTKGPIANDSNGFLSQRFRPEPTTLN